MKKRLRLAVCVIAAVMAFSATAYAGDSDPREVFNAAVKKNANMKYLDTSLDITITLTDGKSSASLGGTINEKLKIAGPAQSQYLGKQTLTSDGALYGTTEIFYHDGYYYVNGDDRLKYKYAMSTQGFMGAAKECIDGLVPDLYNESFDDLDVNHIEMRTEDDNQIISFRLAQEAETNYGDQTYGQNVEISGEYTINSEGYFTRAKLQATAAYTEEDQVLAASVNYDRSINNPDQPFNIEFPDESGFREIDLAGEDYGPAEDGSQGRKAEPYGPAEDAEQKARYKGYDTEEEYNLHNQPGSDEEFDSYDGYYDSYRGQQYSASEEGGSGRLG